MARRRAATTMVAEPRSTAAYNEERRMIEEQLAVAPVRDHAWVRRLFAVVEESPYRAVTAGSYWNPGNAGIEVAIVFDFNSRGLVEGFAAYLAVDVTNEAGFQAMARQAAVRGLKLREREARGMLERHEAQLAAVPYRA